MVSTGSRKVAAVCSDTREEQTTKVKLAAINIGSKKRFSPFFYCNGVCINPLYVSVQRVVQYTRDIFVKAPTF
jgi:hypothetical protein